MIQTNNDSTILVPRGDSIHSTRRRRRRRQSNLRSMSFLFFLSLVIQIIVQPTTKSVIFVSAARPYIVIGIEQQPQQKPDMGIQRQRSTAQQIRSFMIHRRLAHKRKKTQQSRLEQEQRLTSRGRSSGHYGSKVTFQPPTIERVANWFYDTSAQLFDSDGSIRGMLRDEFNHDSVGMTNPSLHIANQEIDPVVSISIGNYNENDENNNSIDSSTIPASTRTMTLKDDSEQQQQESSKSSCWWPSLVNPYVYNKNKNNAWRVLTYRRRVGSGQECYQRVRDAALDWEFDNKDKIEELSSKRRRRLGMMAVRDVASSLLQQQSLQITSSAFRRRRILRRRPYITLPTRSSSNDGTSNNNGNVESHEHSTTNNVRQIWAGPIGGQKFVTFSDIQLGLGWLRLPKLYSINPVKVVYELVDQRGVDTTYTSTAYATMKGHLLRGEERVTVAFRDNENQAVDVEIISISKPGPSLTSKLIWYLPMLGKMQNEFFITQLDALEQIAKQQQQQQTNQPHD